MDKLRRVVGCLKRYNPEEIMIFGSYARGIRYPDAFASPAVPYKTYTKRMPQKL